MSRNEAAFRIGDYFLGRRPNSDVWCACYYDPRTRQTKRHSLGERDLRAAQIALARFVTLHGEIKNAPPATMTIDQLLDRDYQRHASQVRDPRAMARHCRRLLEHFSGKTVADLTPAAIEAFVEVRRRQGRRNLDTDRILDTLRAALNRAKEAGEIATVPKIASVPKQTFTRRLLADDEIAALWAAAAEPHLQMFLAILLNTGARPNVILKLTRFQVDLKHRLLNLHPADQDEETSKRNPVLPITDALLLWLQNATGDHLVSYRGKALDSIKSAWRRARARAGLPEDVTPYSIRHTLATELRARGVPEWECAGWLGHSTPYRTTEIYARYRPDYLSQARSAIDAWMKEIGLPLATEARSETPVRAKNVLGPKARSNQPLERWSEWRDSNTRPQRPERCALPG